VRGGVTDIFFSYSSVDRERVRPIRDALVAQGFDVFWDQQVPAGMDWDSWIRQHLTKSKCAIAFWSTTSASSDNVRHEATVAKQQGKLISVLLEPLTAEQFPLGLYAQQAANLSGWNGDYSHDEWKKFRREFETKLTPLWMRRQIDELEAELVGERARREGVERRDRTMQAQIAKEVEVQQAFKRERDEALDQVAAQKTTVEELTQARADAKARQAENQQALKRERDSALDEVAALKASVEELSQTRAHAEAQVVDLSQRLRKVRQSKGQEIARSMGATLSPFVIAAAVATIGFWTYQLIWLGPQPLPAVTSESAEAEQQQLKDEVQRQTKAAADAETKLKAAEIEQQRLQDEVQRQAKAAADVDVKLKAAETEQQRLTEEVKRQAKAATDSDSGRKAAEAEQQRLKDDVQRQIKAAGELQAALQAAQAEQQRQAKLATDADAKRRGAEAEQQRLAEELRKVRAEAATKQVALPQATSTIMAPSFESRPNMEGVDTMLAGSERISTVQACQERCTQSGTCRAFTFSKTSKLCFFYDLLPSFRFNPNFDSGVRQSAALSQSTATVTASPFESRPNMEGKGRMPAGAASTSTVGVCEEKCTQWGPCKAFTFNKSAKSCDFYDFVPDFSANANFDSGVRLSAQSPTAGQPVSMTGLAQGSFEIKRNTEATGPYLYRKGVASIGECEKVCKESGSCQLFSYGKSKDHAGTHGCFLFATPNAKLIQNDWYDTGIRP
jgi:hypothetical protein